MATHDYVIDNQTAPNFRADLNNALLAIVSNNSNATPPAVTYANMIWYDTATNTLFMRNEDNDAFINLGTLDQTADTFAAAVALASKAEAEAGTDNAHVMTPLRVKQSIAVNAAGPTSLGAIGTYAFLNFNSTSPPTVSPGSTVAGSNMRFSAATTRNSVAQNGPEMVSSTATVSGTWQCMGNLDAGSTNRIHNVTLYLRIS